MEFKVGEHLDITTTNQEKAILQRSVHRKILDAATNGTRLDFETGSTLLHYLETAPASLGSMRCDVSKIGVYIGALEDNARDMDAEQMATASQLIVDFKEACREFLYIQVALVIPNSIPEDFC